MDNEKIKQNAEKIYEIVCRYPSTEREFREIKINHVVDFLDDLKTDLDNVANLADNIVAMASDDA